jgi:flagellin
MIVNGANPSSARNYSINNQATASSLNRLSSGNRINSAGDDAAGLAISERMRGQIGGISKAMQNAQAGVSLAQTAEGALDGSAGILLRMRELATQASNGTYSADDRALLGREFEQLKGSLDQIAESTHYNNTNLLDGSLAEGGLRLQVGTNGTGDDRIDVSIGDMSTQALGLSEINLEDPNAALEAIDSAINTVSQTRGDIGAVQDRLESTITNLSVAEYNITASESNIRDLDMAKEVLNRTQRQILAEASQASQVHQMNLMRQNAAHLLK